MFILAISVIVWDCLKLISEDDLIAIFVIKIIIELIIIASLLKD